MNWNYARCKKNRYCDFTTVHEDRGAKVERCIYCGRRTIFRKVNGKTDNVQYLKMHVRNFAQPYGATRKVFEEVYGSQRLLKFDRDLDRNKWRVDVKSNKYKDDKRREVMDFYNTLGQSSR